jgi:hypothetical protein
MLGGERKESPPDPEPFDGALPAGETAGERELLYVSADDHLANEYDLRPRVCHRAFRLFAAGNGG